MDKCYEVTFYSKVDNIEIGAEMVNVPDEKAASDWASRVISNGFFEDEPVSWTVEEVK